MSKKSKSELIMDSLPVLIEAVRKQSHQEHIPTPLKTPEAAANEKVWEFEKKIADLEARLTRGAKLLIAGLKP